MTDGGYSHRQLAVDCLFDIEDAVIQQSANNDESRLLLRQLFRSEAD